MQSPDTRERLLGTFIGLIVGAHEVLDAVTWEQAP
jgi:hypothetical protein